MSKNKTTGDSQNYEAEIEQLTEKWKRALADYENLQKRVLADSLVYELKFTARLVKEFLPLYDSLQEALNQVSQKEGYQSLLTQFENILASFGVHKITLEVGEEFNPQLHEAVEVVKEGKENTIARIITNGFMIQDNKVIRPVKVAVNKT